MPDKSETHCATCGEPLSEYGHCWQHDYPLTAADDPREAAAPSCNGQSITTQPETFNAEAREWEQGGQYGG